MLEQTDLKGPDTGRQGPEGAAGSGISPLEPTVVGSTGALRGSTAEEGNEQITGSLLLKGQRFRLGRCWD